MGAYIYLAQLIIAVGLVVAICVVVATVHDTVLATTLVGLLAGIMTMMKPWIESKAAGQKLKASLFPPKGDDK